MTEPSAKVICDSISLAGHRLTTIEVTMHRFVLAEFNTHRVFSRNSASSRAIPVSKQIKRVCDDMAVPVAWPGEQKGMQGGEPLSDRDTERAMEWWAQARDTMVEYAEHLTKLGVHKSVVNRLLEPFMWHTVIVTSTEWDNFWGLRCNPMAQPEIRLAAEAMKRAYDASQPDPLPAGGWHIPYVAWTTEPDGLEEDFIGEWAVEHGMDPMPTICKVSAARCARVSYLTHDGKRDIEADLQLFDRLVSADPPHASPLEHVATPCPEFDFHQRDEHFGHQGNFTGWDQLRHKYIKEG